MLKVNYHTHTYRCGHASGNESDYLVSALNKGVNILGFSDHAPYPDNKYNRTNDSRMKFSELNDYINTIASLQEKYKNNITILKGLEIEYSKSDSEYYDYLLNDLKMDYLVLGQHIFHSNGSLLHTFSLDSSDNYIDYALSVSEALNTNYFKFLAHPDLIFINKFSWDDNCEKACEIIIESAKNTNTILELNANGFRRGLMNFPDGTRYPYPHDRFWEKVSKTDIKVLINSDCHNPDSVWDEYMDKAYEYANNLRLNIIYEI